MATTTIRTTVAFDPATAARLERLAKRWGVSKSEAMRRALEAAETPAPAKVSSDQPNFEEMTPIEILDWLRVHPQVAPGWGEAIREDLRITRERDAELEEEGDRRRIVRQGATPELAP